MPERFHSGWLIYQHEATEEPRCHAEWSVAAESLKSRMREYADADDDQAIEDVDWDQVGEEREAAWWASDEAPAMLATVGAILRDDPPREPHNYLAVAEDHNYRQICFYLFKLVCEDPAHLESDE